ncbi:MAG: histidine phosphatase family protein [Flavobacteriaceae bacterium]|nr:histidine phosphatase family protein [Flavobacteriaceae bacterium]
MKKLILCALIISSVFLSCTEQKQPVQEEVISTYYLIRHAEKDRSDKTNRNPNLMDKGTERAVNWSTVFKDVSFDMVYSTDYNRTKQTATPTAKSKELTLLFYNPRTLFDEEFQKATKGKTVLVVGHSNTTPNFANAILGSKKYDQIDDHNNANLYIVTLTNNTKTGVLLKVD